MSGEVILTGITLCVSFSAGAAAANIRYAAKRKARRERRQRIINFHRNVTDEICRWELEHPVLLLSAPSAGRVIFKGGADKMTDREFCDALRNGFAATASAASEAMRAVRNAIRQLNYSPESDKF